MVRVHSTVCAAMSDPQDTYRSVVVALFCGGLYLLADAIARSLIQQSLFEIWFHYYVRHPCGRDSGCSGVCQRTHRHSSRTVLRSQRHHHQPIGCILMAPKNTQLTRVYFDPKCVASYIGADALRRITRVPRNIVEEWLSEQDAYTLHKPARRHFRRRRVIVGGPRQQWQADFVDLTNLKTDNDVMSFLLTVIDFFTKVAWCVPLKNKSAASLVAALTTTFTKGWPKTLQTDQGLEFLNKSVQALLKKYGIHHFSIHNAETKASIVERFNRTLKTRMWRHFTKHQMWRYIDVLQDLVQSYNNTPPPPQHRHGSVTGELEKSRGGVAASVRSRW